MNNKYFICDIGNAYIKSIYENNKVCFPARLGKSLILNNKKNDIITYDNESHVIGHGIYNIKNRKIDRKEIIEFILASVAKLSNESKISVEYLVVALPLGQLKSDSTSLKNLLESQKYHQFTFNDRDIIFEYNSVVILPEAVCAYYSILDKVDDLIGDTLIIDVGGGTTDIVYIDTEGSASNTKTINIGSIKLLQHIATYIEENFSGTGVIHLEKVSDYLNNGFIYNGDKCNLDEAFNYIHEDISYIIQQLNAYYSTELSTCTVIVIDNLGILYSELIKEFKHSNIVHINDVFCNVLGMEIIIKNIIQNL